MILFFSFRKALKRIFARRFDGAPTLPYARAKDFGITEEKFSFKTQHNWILSGSRYYKNGIKPKALIIFFHGLGDGRASYIKSICQLAEAGYLVYAYDNTGCMESEGNRIYSLTHVAIDQEYFFKWLDKDKLAKGLKRYSIGHSWGGYGASISSKNEYKIEKVVNIAGFNDPMDVIMAKLSRKLMVFKPILALSVASFSFKYALLKASDIMNKSNAQFLYIQGKDDKEVTISQGYSSFKKHLNKTVNINYMILEHRGHSVYKSEEAEEYVTRIIKEGILSTGATKNIEMNLDKATKENEVVWNEIFRFLNS